MKVLITGGCGFIGTNAVQRFSDLGHTVTIFDDLSRFGSELNLEWLRTRRVVSDFVKADVRCREDVERTVRDGRFDAILHLAGQVAVTASVEEPRRDFEINALGTLNVLEAVRQCTPETIVLNASTNKVYGKLSGIVVREAPDRYTVDDPVHGIPESQCLDFHSPYGCSKGAADQYVTDYSRIYGLRTVNFRQSCIYGNRQFGVEDQGWVAWFVIAHLLGRPITIYGTGKQVRDVLFIDDLIDLYLAAIQHIDQVRGATFNVGGGPANTLSVLECMNLIGDLSGRKVTYELADWRPGDQPVYVSDIRNASSRLGWHPRIGVGEGMDRLFRWVGANRDVFARPGRSE